MLVLHRFILLLVLAGYSLGAQAGAPDQVCDSAVLDLLREQLIEKLEGIPEDFNFDASACKIWPHDKNLLLAVVAYPNGRDDEKKVVVAAVDVGAKKVAHSTNYVIYEDAVTQLGHFIIDTAPYLLAPGVRGFGVRHHNGGSGASCGDGYWGDQLTLYMPDGKMLRSVFRMHMYRQQASEGCLSARSGKAFWEGAQISLSISKTKTNGFFDLIVAAKLESGSEGYAEADYAKKARNRVERKKMQFDGVNYRRPQDAPWWMGSENEL